MDRKEFLKLAAPAFLILANGDILFANPNPVNPNSVNPDHFNPSKSSQSRLRFAIASDGHYGEPNTDYENYFRTLVDKVNEEDRKDPFAFIVINGDIVHDDKKHYPAAKKILDKLKPKYYVSQGNHDKVTAEEWKDIWHMPVNFEFEKDDNAFLVATTSDVNGTYLSPDIDWCRKALQKHTSKKNVFVFIHINPAKLTDNAVDAPEIVKLFSQHKNVRAVFNGHDHDKEGILKKENIPFVFDAHFGGSWGTNYRGFRVVELLEDQSIYTYIMNPSSQINVMTLLGQNV